MRNQEKVPITIIAGFLGAGKTTLLNNILSLPRNQKQAVIVNDYGKVNIGSRFIKATDEDVIELSDGCICCSIRANFIDAVLKLLKSSSSPDHIIAECSGVSDPINLTTILMSPALRNLIKVDGIITVVDAKEFEFSFQKFSMLVINQINLSNLVIINKTDMVTDEEKESLRNSIRDINSKACIIEAVNADVPAELLLGFMEVDPESSDLNVDKVDVVDAAQYFDSKSYCSSEVFSKKALDEWKDRLPSEIVRAKGVINLGCDGGFVSFNLVGSWSRFEQIKDVSEVSETEIVFIGNKGWAQNYDFKKDLESCLQKN